MVWWVGRGLTSLQAQTVREDHSLRVALEALLVQHLVGLFGVEGGAALAMREVEGVITEEVLDRVLVAALAM